MSEAAIPMILQLAPLPRTQVGPYLILGVDKGATREVVESAWAQRVIWARKGLIQTPLEDINWAREALSSPESRIRNDAVSLNLDTCEGTLRKLVDRFQGKQNRLGGAKPLDTEKWLAEFSPATRLPDLAEVRAAIPSPEIPGEVPCVRPMLEETVRQPLDPWEIQLDS